MSSAPKSVRDAPPPWTPPGCAATTGSRKQRFMSSTRSQARRYDMPSVRPACEIEPWSRIASSNSTLPGPSARSGPKSTRKVSLVPAIPTPDA